MNWMIYGANGFTGKLIAQEALRAGLKPVLAGRNRDVIEALGRELALPVRVFGLTAAPELGQGLEGIGLVVHCAGPFSKTSEPMIDACLAAGSHYLDISGELKVFENIYARHGEWIAKRLLAVPGVGFDVVPTDILANLLKAKLPDATRLELGVMTTGGISTGTTKTIVEGLAGGGYMRRDGKLVSVRIAQTSFPIQFGKSSRIAVSQPAAELASAFRSTGIPEIETFVATVPSQVRAIKVVRIAAPLLAIPALQRSIQKLAGRFAQDPSAELRARTRSNAWGKVFAPGGRTASLRAAMQDPYDFTALSAVRAVERILEGKSPTGALTPSQAFGSAFLSTITGTSVTETT